jgi:hypothetical protein
LICKASSMAVVLKIACQGQTHRIPFDEMPNYAALDAAVKDSLGICGEYAAKYVDEEGDRCTLVESTFPDFLTTATSVSGEQAILRVEVSPLPGGSTAPVLSATVPVVRSHKAYLRRQQQMPKSVWADDERDLDELLLQLVDEPAAKKSRKKNKNKSRASKAVHNAQDSNSSSVESEKEVPSKEETEMPKVIEAVTEDLEMSISTQGITGKKDDNKEITNGSNYEFPEAEPSCMVAFGPSLEPVESITAELQEEKISEAQRGRCRQQKKITTAIQEEDEEESPAAEDRCSGLRRASSCPCLPVSGVMEIESDDNCKRSLMEQAWPFVDTDKLSANLSNLLHHSSSDLAAATTETSMVPSNGSFLAEGVRSTLANTESPAPSMHPCSYAFPQVVWVPMIVNWPRSDFEMNAPYAGVAPALTDNAIIAVG